MRACLVMVIIWTQGRARAGMKGRYTTSIARRIDDAKRRPFARAFVFGVANLQDIAISSLWQSKQHAYYVMIIHLSMPHLQSASWTPNARQQSAAAAGTREEYNELLVAFTEAGKKRFHRRNVDGQALRRSNAFVVAL